MNFSIEVTDFVVQIMKFQECLSANSAIYMHAEGNYNNIRSIFQWRLMVWNFFSEHSENMSSCLYSFRVFFLGGGGDFRILLLTNF
jgi:hypothetical protein